MDHEHLEKVRKAANRRNIDYFKLFIVTLTYIMKTFGVIVGLVLFLLTVVFCIVFLLWAYLCAIPIVIVNFIGEMRDGMLESVAIPIMIILMIIIGVSTILGILAAVIAILPLAVIGLLTFLFIEHLEQI